MLSAASQLATSQLALQVPASELQRLDLFRAQADRATHLIAQNRRGMFAAESDRVTEIARQIDVGWRQLNAIENGASSRAPESTTTEVPAPALVTLRSSFSQMFAAITAQSLSSDVIADVSEVGSDVNYLMSLYRLIDEQGVAALESELLAAHQNLVASADRLRARTGSGGKLRGYQVRQLIEVFSAAVQHIGPMPVANLAASGPREVASSAGDRLYVLAEQLRGILTGALARYRVIVLGLFISLFIGLLSTSLICLRLWRYHRRALSDFAASNVEATLLKQSWVEQANAIAAGDCTNRWRATDETNSEIANALNGTTDTISNLVRKQKGVAIELREHSLAIKDCQSKMLANVQARQAALSELAERFTHADMQVERARDWLGQIGAVATEIRDQAEQLASAPAVEQAEASSTVAQQYRLALSKLSNAEQVLEQAVDQIVGVRQITDQSKLVALNVSLQMVADGADDDMSAELAEQAQRQTALVESEVTQIERSVRSVSDELHACISQLQSASESESTEHVGNSAQQALVESLVQGVVALCEISTDLNDFTAQRVAQVQAMQRKLQQVRDLQEADERMLANCGEWLDQIDRVGDNLRESVAHYVIPVTGR